MLLFKRALYSAVLAGALSACSSSESAKPTADAPAKVQQCQSVTQEEIAALFDRWNNSLATGNPEKVVENYAPESILLPTISNKPRLTAEEKADYFHHFLADQPSGKIDMSFIQIGCNTALDAGLYTFTYAKTGKKASGRYSYTYAFDGKDWLITHHHSSLMPEKATAKKEAKKK